MAGPAPGTPESNPRIPSAGASPSPASSAESNFRSLDDAFLQTQTRIWLGEVLQIRLDEQANISDILADGEILLELSEIIPKMLPNLAVDATLPKSNDWKSPASNKSTRRYMAYHNVGAFLQVCKNLGLDSIDLFSPSDVVEKRNTRKVCICLRSLSKKVRSRNLNVPDFDSVTCTLAMPSDKVQYIRMSLEQSQSSSSLSVEQDSEKASRIRYWERMSDSQSSISNSYSDNCEDAESNSIISGSHLSSNHTSDATSPTILGPESRDDESNLKLQLSVDLEDDGDVEVDYLSPAESVGSHLEYYSDQELSSVQSSTCLSSCIDDKVLEVNGKGKRGYQNVNVNHVPIDLEDSSRDIQNYRNSSASHDENDDAHDGRDRDKAEFDVCSLQNMHMENHAHPSELECENNSCGNIKSVCCMDSTSVVDRVSIVSHESAVEDDLCAAEAPVSESESCEDESMQSKNNISKSHSCDLSVIEDDSCTDETPISKFKGIDEQHMEAEEETFSHGVIPDNAKLHSDKVANDDDIDNDIPSESVTHSEEVAHARENSGDESVDYVETIPKDGSGRAKLHPEQSLCSVDSSAESICCSYPEATKSNASGYDSLSPKLATNSSSALLPDVDMLIAASIHQSPTTNVSPRAEDAVIKHDPCVETIEKDESENVEGDDNKDIQLHKPQRKLLKSIVKGTAAVGLAAFLLYLRTNFKPNLPKDRQQPANPVSKKPAAKPSSEKVQKADNGSTRTVYPAQKFRFGI